MQLAAIAVVMAVPSASRVAHAQGSSDATVLDAREAFRKKDRARLALTRASAAAVRVRSSCQLAPNHARWVGSPGPT